MAVNRFHPETVAIKVGQKVTWRVHSDWMPHTVSFEPPFKSPAEPNATGKYPYLCLLHPGMAGTVEVS